MSDGGGVDAGQGPTAHARAKSKTAARRLSLSLAESLAQQLIADIAEGRYPVGERLPPESDLAEAAEVSRLTVREAVKTLQERGILSVRRGIGTFVNHPEEWSPLHSSVLAARALLMGDHSRARINADLLEARSFFEVGVAGAAAERRTEEDLTAMKAALEEMRAQFDDVDAFVEADVDFHDALMQAAGNSILAAMYHPVHELFYKTRRETAKSSVNRQRAIWSHEQILSAVEAGSRADAQAAMDVHLDEAKEMF
jgi:GntR family transcriptional repressor for pyruvate dehydrogenase complex